MTVRFRYRAASAGGRVIEGVLQAQSRQTALAELERQHLFPVAIDELVTASATPTKRRLGRRAAVTLWTRSAASLLAAGLPLDQVLGFTAGHAGHPDLTDALRQIRRAVQGGSDLATALAQHPRYFDSLFTAAVSAGESSGALDTVFERLAEHLGCRIAKNLLGTLVEEYDPLLGINRDNRVIGDIQDAGEARLR